MTGDDLTVLLTAILTVALSISKAAAMVSLKVRGKEPEACGRVEYWSRLVLDKLGGTALGEDDDPAALKPSQKEKAK